MRALLLIALAASAAAADPAPDLATWRAEHEKEIAADDGWLSVVGLFWLEEGENKFGTAPENQLVFPAGTVSPVAGTITRKGRTFTLDGMRELRPDSVGRPDIVEVGRVSFFIIERNGRFGLRVRDRESPARKAFTGLTWFPPNDKLRVEARFVPYAGPKTMQVPNVLGQAVPMQSPGRAVFKVGGRKLSLDAVLEAPDAPRLFFIFGDATTEKQTYGGGRFLYTDLPKAGKVVLDFNRAENPPCAFTEFATCPLPPRQNRLPVAIEAGETYTPHEKASLRAEELLINANASDRLQALVLHDGGCLDLAGWQATFDGAPVKVENLGGHNGGCAYVGFDIRRPPAKKGPVAVVISGGETRIEATFDDLLVERSLRPRAAGARPGDEVTFTADPPPGALRDAVVQGVVGDETSFLLEGGAVVVEGAAIRVRLPPNARAGVTQVYLRGAAPFEAPAMICSGISRCRAEVGVSYTGTLQVTAGR